MSENGLQVAQQMLQAGGDRRIGKTTVMEAFAVDHLVRDAIRALPLDSDTIFAAACRQLQYETLPMASIRAVETRGARLADCRTSLGRELAARAHTPLRELLARELAVSLSEVSQRIDRLLEAQDRGEVAFDHDGDFEALTAALRRIEPGSAVQKQSAFSDEPSLGVEHAAT